MEEFLNVYAADLALPEETKGGTVLSEEEQQMIAQRTTAYPNEALTQTA